MSNYCKPFIFLYTLALSFTGLFLCIGLSANAQSVALDPMGPLSLDADVRVMQLQQQISPAVSFTIRPITPSRRFVPDTLYKYLFANPASLTNSSPELAKIVCCDKKPPIKELKLTFLKRFGKISLLPVSVVAKYASHHPYGWSDGAFLPANGLQTVMSGGVYAKLGPLSIQFRPEYLMAQNTTYETTPAFGANSPEKNYKKFFYGQSKASLGVGPIAVALSTENLWWGPGQYTSLMMSNNAPGFLHLSFQTRRPLKTIIGNFEWNLIAGKAEDELSQSDEVFALRTYSDLFGNPFTKTPYYKYINALGITYQPFFMKGLYVGATRSFVSPYDNVVENLAKTDGFVRAYLPVFDQLFKNKLTNEDQRNWNQLISLYMRLLMSKSNAEAYLEYGWNDHSYNMRDFLMAPTHSAAYLAGFKKLVPLRKNKWLDLNAEINQMEQAPDYLVRGAGSWYVHGWDANYSHLGQVLGSGIGYGANVFTLRGTIRKKFKQVGMSFERLQHDPNEFSVRWTDLVLGVHGRYNFKSLCLSAECKAIRSGNYGWVQDKNKFNFTCMLSVTYGW